MPDRAGFALALADRFHLHPEVALGWTYWENTDDSEKRRAYNWLNLKWDTDVAGVPHTTEDKGLDGGFFPGYANFANGLKAATIRISNDRYAGIRASGGKSKDEQVAAIIASDWGTKHLSTREFTNSQLEWCWIAWYLGEGWAHAIDLGPHNQSHRPEVFPRPIPNEWWGELGKIISGRHGD